jgi:alcohol dehydrogenase (cytochrome c)
MGLGGKDEVGVAGIGSYITAIDYKTGKTVWPHNIATATNGGRGAPILLATAAKLLFGGDVSGNFLALDRTNGKLLSHARIGQVSNAPPTYLVDGPQHVPVAAEDRLYSFALYQRTIVLGQPAFATM